MGIRTPDLLIANETLYQLSYTPLTLRIGHQPSGKHYAAGEIGRKKIYCGGFLNQRLNSSIRRTERSAFTRMSSGMRICGSR